MNKIFLWDSGEHFDCLEKNKNFLDQRAYLMLRLGDILYMAYQCIPNICPEMIDVSTRGAKSWFAQQTEQTYLKTYIRFSDIASIYFKLRDKLRGCNNCKEIAEMAFEICAPYDTSERLKEFVIDGEKWKGNDLFHKETVSYLETIYNFHASIKTPRRLPSIFRELSTLNSSPDKLSKLFSSGIDSANPFDQDTGEANRDKVNDIVYEHFFPNDNLRRGKHDIAWCTSIYHFIIKSAIGTIKEHNLPFVPIERKNCNELTEKLQEFIKRFRLYELNISTQSREFQNTASYIFERLTNVNLINSVYKVVQSANRLNWLNFSVLAMHPLIQFRYELIKELDRRKSPETVIPELLCDQTFFYFPLLCRLFDLLTQIYECERNLPDKETNSNFDLRISYDFDFNVLSAGVDKKNDTRIIPTIDFPILRNKSNELLYACVARTVYEIYLLSLNLPSLSNVIHASHWYNQPGIYLHDIYENPDIKTEIQEIINKSTSTYSS